MRPEYLLKCEVTSFFVAGDTGAFAIDNMEADDIERRAKQNYNLSLEEVKKSQAKDGNKGEMGYILHGDLVYKVNPNNNTVIKITGAEAKPIKKRLNEIANHLLEAREEVS